MVMRLRILLLWMVIATPLSRSADPTWWVTRSVTNQNPAANLAPATIGQAKHMAAMALAELDGKLPTHQALAADLGQIVNLSLPDPLPAGFHEQQRAVLLTGQIKAIARPFYDHLRAHDAAWLDNAMNAAQITVMEPGISPATRSPYPWSESTTDDANRAPATLGQLKAVFSLPLETLPSTPPAIVDTDGDGMPDAWEILYGLNSNDSNDANGDLDRDGISNIREYQLGLSPTEHNQVGIQNAGTQVEDGKGNIFSFRDEYPSDLYLQDSIPGWQAVEGEYIEVWDEGDGNVYAELQSHFEAKGIKQEFNLLPGESFTFLLRYKGRYDNFDDSNPFTLKVEGAHRLLVDGEPARQTGDAWEASFMEDDNWDTLPYEDWHYATVVIESDPEATTLEEITLSLIPNDLDPEITHGGFVALLLVEINSPHADNAYQTFFSNSDDAIYPCPDWVAANNTEEIHKSALVIYHNDAPSASTAGRRYVEINFSVGGIKKIEGIGWAVSRKSINGHNYTSWSDRTLTKEYIGDKVAGNSGGLYRYHIDGTKYYGNVWLPLAGPDIAEFWESEITYFKTKWESAYSAKLRRLSEPLQQSTIAMVTFWTKQAAFDMGNLGKTLDWNDSERILKDYAPTAGLRDNEGGGARYTCYERVLDLRKSSNMMYALIGRCMGLEEVILSNAGDSGTWFGELAGATGTPDSAAAKESYQAGFDLFDGISLKDVMINRGEKMQEPNSWAQREWPSEEKSGGKLKRTNEQLLQSIIQ